MSGTGPLHRIAARFLTAMANRDAAELRDVLAEKVIWHVPPSTMPQFSGPHRGSDRAVQLIMDAGGTLFVEGTQRLMILQSVAEGDQVAVRFRMSGRTQGGVVYDNLYAFFFRIAADKIAELWENVDTAYVYGALGIIPDWLTDVP